jgi:hypothetical protein
MKKLFRPHYYSLGSSLKEIYEFKDFGELVAHLNRLYPTLNIIKPIISFYHNDPRLTDGGILTLSEQTKTVGC